MPIGVPLPIRTAVTTSRESSSGFGAATSDRFARRQIPPQGELALTLARVLPAPGRLDLVQFRFELFLESALFALMALTPVQPSNIEALGTGLHVCAIPVERLSARVVPSFFAIEAEHVGDQIPYTCAEPLGLPGVTTDVKGHA
jgi:hypothetical protein